MVGSLGLIAFPRAIETFSVPMLAFSRIIGGAETLKPAHAARARAWVDSNRAALAQGPLPNLRGQPAPKVVPGSLAIPLCTCRSA